MHACTHQSKRLTRFIDHILSKKRVKRKADEPRHYLHFLPRTHYWHILDQLPCQGDTDALSLCHSHGCWQERPLHIRRILPHCPWLPTRMRKPACSDLDPEVMRLLESHCWCLESDECLHQCVTKSRSCLRLYLCPLNRTTTAAIKIKLSRPIWHRLFLTNTATVFSDHHQQPSVSTVGGMTAGPGLDWREHLRCPPGTPRAEPEHKCDCNKSATTQ